MGRDHLVPIGVRIDNLLASGTVRHVGLGGGGVPISPDEFPKFARLGLSFVGSVVEHLTEFPGADKLSRRDDRHA